MDPNNASQSLSWKPNDIPFPVEVYCWVSHLGHMSDVRRWNLSCDSKKKQQIRGQYLLQVKCTITNHLEYGTYWIISKYCSMKDNPTETCHLYSARCWRGPLGSRAAGYAGRVKRAGGRFIAHFFLDECGGFHKWGYPQMDGLRGNIPSKWMI